MVKNMMDEEKLLTIKHILNAEEMHYKHDYIGNKQERRVYYNIKERGSSNYYIITFWLDDKRIGVNARDIEPVEALPFEQYRKIVECCDILGWNQSSTKSNKNNKIDFDDDPFLNY